MLLTTSIQVLFLLLVLVVVCIAAQSIVERWDAFPNTKSIRQDNLRKNGGARG